MVVRFEMLSAPEPPPGGREFLSAVIRAAFGKRRKMLKNALAAVGGLGYSETRIRAACVSAGIDPRSRAEQLSADDFIHLAAALTGFEKNGSIQISQ